MAWLARSVITLLLGISLFACSKPEPFLPPPNFQADATLGRQIYQQHCAVCHGQNLRGNALKGPPLINEVYRPDHHADLAFYQAVRSGVLQHHWHFGNMPTQPDVTPEMTGHVVAYVRQEQRNAGIF
ncbi:MAG: c-type cytochrome [Gammaproteobacteria bacterium]|nr:c-type cytochrome [Gammaproteobacteria bacterium]